MCARDAQKGYMYMKFSELDMVRIAIFTMTIWFLVILGVLGNTTSLHIPTLIGYSVVAFVPMPIFWFLSDGVFSRYRPE